MPRYPITWPNRPRRFWDAGHPCLRWWSVFGGEWLGAVLFTDRLTSRLSFDEPEELTVDALPVGAAAEALGMERSTS